MGQKVHPIGFRLGIVKSWDSRWFAKKEYASLIHEDLKIRKFVKKKLFHAGISKVEIERTGNKLRVNIHSARPGLVIGKLHFDNIVGFHQADEFFMNGADVFAQHAGSFVKSIFFSFYRFVNVLKGIQNVEQAEA